MKYVRRLFAFLSLFVFSMLLTLPILAQTNVPAPTPAPAPTTLTGLLLAVIPLLAPALVAAIKWLSEKFLGALPGWTLPILCSGLGELINYLSGVAGGPTVSPVVAVLLGLAGVGLRHVAQRGAFRRARARRSQQHQSDETRVEAKRLPCHFGTVRPVPRWRSP